ncbi:PAS domain S-box-containing protein/diguanylate cyclase (GGDEF) domain-containing protein [Janthinobacterium sp. TND4EL3]|uniref:GGDEF domain-containing protein n=1 Tax=Janthinobacterium sp. TND4EL3 TaxID=1907311 RepID=UPI0009550941|nr:sensor domain-containing diguanylate cyclase [Janthinobacterium sp. TND4EL3]SIR76199.1 PAS domain S-box-containing protein/diguanylate cyclase (GGDEF) domain-containing protein [Janthinobacterium sp. TND4EL3]
MTDALPAAPPAVLSEVLFSRLLEDALDAVIIIDEQCRIRYINGAMQALSGYASGELLGQTLNGLLPDAVASQHDNLVINYIRSSRQSSVLGKIREFAIRHRNAQMIPIEMKALDLGVVDGMRYFGAFLLDVRERRELAAKNASLLAQLEQQALHDALTSLPNRRAYEAQAEQAMARAARSGAALTVGVADLDHFKKINDRHGHAVGDAVLRNVAQVLRDTGRVTDVAARMGGEEFGLLFPDATLPQAQMVAERIRAAVAAAVTVLPDGSPLHVTISIGLAPLARGASMDAAMSEADKALYVAKHQGRNQVMAALAAE